MTDVIPSIARALRADVDALDAISHNIANLNTAGYRSTAVIPDFGAELTRVSISQADGPLAQTGRSLDLALRGNGFFAVEREGQVLLARAGDFRVDAEGWLVTQAGERVLGEAGGLQIPAGRLAVAADGGLTVDGRPLDRLRLVDVGEPGRLRPAGGGLFAYDGELVEWRGSVVQGAIERANVDAAEQTVRLMEVTRHAESVQRAIATYDRMLDTGINKLGEN